MYQNNHPSAARRSGDEFLRRMLSSELHACPSHASMPAAPIQHHSKESCSCGHRHDASDGCTPSLPPIKCATPSMPALAMVYSPEQAWQSLYTPEQALAAGTLFDELNKPFEGRTIANHTQRGCRA